MSEISQDMIETRPFPPFLPPEATVMLMGTFPPAGEKRSMAFHYPNFQNDMWRVYGLVFFNDAAHFQRPSEKAFDADKIKAFLMERGIASCPTVYKAVRERGNASDKFLKVVEPVDLQAGSMKCPTAAISSPQAARLPKSCSAYRAAASKCPKRAKPCRFPTPAAS